MREIPRDQRTDRNSKLGTGSEIRAKVDLMAHLQYLEHTVEQRLQAALEELISKQPEDPICYLADHFYREVKPGREPLLIAADQLRDLKPGLSQQSLDSTIYKIYALLSNCEDDCFTTGVLGSEINSLIRQMCCDLDPSIADALLRKLHVQDSSSVRYPPFKTRVTVCMLLLEFLQTTVQLFEVIDTCGNGSILRQTGEDLLSRLSAALSVSLDVRQNVEQTKYLLKPLQAETATVKKDVQDRVTVEKSDREGDLLAQEFQQLAARVFISHLPRNSLIG